MTTRKRTKRATPASSNPPPAVHRLAYTVNFAVASGAISSRNKFYAAIASGELRSFKDGKRRLVSHEALVEYIRKRERKTAEAGA